MTTRTACIALALAVGACSVQGQRSDLPILKVVPPTLVTGATGNSCTFDTGTDEYSYLPVNLSENLGNVGVVVRNNIQDPSTLNPLFRVNTATFQPHQAVITYEVLGAGTNSVPTTPTVVPVSGVEVATGQQGSIGVPMFAGAAITATAGDFIRVTFHIEGKLQDDSKVSTSEREYVFIVCATAGCGQQGPWGTCL
jgi:hypothetical protein